MILQCSSNDNCHKNININEVFYIIAQYLSRVIYEDKENELLSNKNYEDAVTVAFGESCCVSPATKLPWTDACPGNRLHARDI